MADPRSVWDEVLSVLQKTMGLREKAPVERGSKKYIKNLMRPDGTMKGAGWLGMLPMTGEHEGSVMTELSTGGNTKLPSVLDQRTPEPLMPLVTPNQPPDAISWLLAGGKPGPDIYRRAREHAEKQKAQGKPVFAPGLLVPTTERPKSRTGEFGMAPAKPRTEGYLPGERDNLAEQQGIASDDPYQLAAKLEAYRRHRK